MADTPIADYRTRWITERLERTGGLAVDLDTVRAVLAAAYAEAFERTGHGEHDPEMWLWFAAHEAGRAADWADKEVR